MHFKAPMARQRATRPFPILLFRFLAGALLATALAGAASAADFLILLDLDNDLGTGCMAVTPGGSFAGIEQILTTTVTPTGANSADVTAVSVETCAGGVFGPPAAVNSPVAPPWAVGVGLGDGGTNVIETYLTKALLPPGNLDPQAIRLVVIGDDGGATADVAGPAVWTLAQVIEIPTLGASGLLLLAALFAAAAILVLRRGGAAGLAIVLLLAGAGAAWAAITLDGDPSDWSLGDRVTTDPAEGTTPGADIVSVYAKDDTVGGVPSLAFRVDATLVFNQPPVAGDDSATVAEDSGATTINVLANDSDPDGDPFSIGSVTQPANGTVAITNGGADLTYTPNPNYCNAPPGTTLDTFTYTLTPGGDSATVTVTVTCVVDNPVAVPDTATVGEDSGATAIDVQANDSDPDGISSISAVTQPANGTVVNNTTNVTYQPNPNYCNTPPGTTLDTFTYTLAPGGSSTTVTVTVNCGDDPPTAVNDSTTVNEDSGANTINVQANDTDIDGGTNTIQSITQPANGVVAITNGGADLSYTPNANYCNSVSGPDDTFTYTLNGGSSATVTVTVTCIDDDPTAVNDTASVAEDAAATTVDVLANDTDPDGGTNTIQSVTQPANGTVVITNAGADLTYQPNPNYCNTPPGTTLDTFTYTLTPGGSTATVSVTVTCVDDNPTAVNDTATVAEDSGANTIDVQANDTDPDAGTNAIQSVTQPANGTVVITNAGADLTYAPNANYCNTPPGTTPDTFTYTLSPGGSSATVSVTVNCVDDPPLAVNDSAGVSEDPPGANTINVMANDVDIDGGANTIQSVTQPANGTVAITNGGLDLTYLPNPNYCNTPPGSPLDTFTYTLSPGGSTATVSVTVNCVNDGPQIDLDANDDKGTGGVNFAVTFTENDPATLIEDPLDATVTDVDSANVQTLTVTLTNLLDPTFEVLDADLTGFPSISKNYDVVGTPGQGILTLTGPDVVANFQSVLRTVTYRNTDADPDATARIIQFVATDDAAGAGNTATTTVTIVPVDVAPTAVADTATVNEDSGANAIDVLANDTDPDGGPKSVASVTQPTNGSVTNNGTDVSYTPNSNYCNSVSGPTDTFTYTLTPGGSSTTVTVTVTCVDDNPVAVADSTTAIEDDAIVVNVLANDTDADGGPKSIQSVTQPANGTVVNNTTDLSYTPNANYCNDPPGTTLDTFTYTLTPGGSSTTVTMTVTCVDDNPVAVADSSTVTEDSGANTINVLANDTDVDGGAKSVSSVTQPANGTVVNNTTDVSYTPNPNYCNNPPGTTLDTFTYTLAPGSSSTTVTVTVTCVDDPPVAVADAATVNEDSGANAIDVLANDTDIDAGPKSVTSVTQPANGTVVNNGTNVTYAPNANYCNNPPGTTLDSFTYTLTPGSSSTTVTVTVTCVNDPPVADPDLFDYIGNTQLEVDQDTAATPETLETTPSTLGVLDGDSDPVENDSFAVSGIAVGACTDNSGPTFDCTDPAVGTVHMTTSGQFSFEPSPGDTGAAPTGCAAGAVDKETFQYTVTDTGSPAPASSTGTVTLCRFERVWWVDPNAGGGGAGTSLSPFNVLDSLDGVGGAGDSDATGDYLFVHDGTLAMSASLPMEANQHLIGEGSGLSIPVNLNGNGSPTVLMAAGTKPQVTNATGDAVTIGTAIPIEIIGLSLASTTGNAIDQTSAAALTGSTTLTINNVTFRGAGAEGVDFNLNAGTTGTLTLNFTSNTWDLAGTHTGNGFDARTAAAGAVLQLNFSNNSPIVGGNAAGAAVLVDRSGGGTITMTGFANNVVHQNTAGAGMSINVSAFDSDVVTAGFQTVSGGTTAIGTPGDGVGGAGMLLTASGDLSFTDLDIFASGGAAFSLVGGGTFTGASGTRVTVGAGVGIFEATGGPAVTANGATIDLQLSSLKSTNSASTGVSLVNVADGTTAATFSAPSGSTIINASGTDFVIDGSNATVTYNGTITDDVGQLVNVANTTADSKSFTGAITDGDDGDGSGISLTNNTGATITFSGGVVLSTGANAAFAATGGGTLNVCDENPCNPGATGGNINKITTTTGTALNVANTTIGANNLEFRSIAANGATNGIVLNTTGSSGGLKVKGDNGGSNNGSGGTIQNTTAEGILLGGTANVSLGYMNITNSGTDSIRITNINGFTLNRSNIDDAAGTAPADKAVDIGDFVTGTPVNGTMNFTNDVIGPAAGNSPHDSLAIGISSGTSTWNVTNTTIRRTGNAGINMEARGTSVLTATVSGCNFAGANVAGSGSPSARGIFVNSLDDAVITMFSITGNTFTNNNIHIDMNQQNDTDPVGGHTFEILNNTTMTGARSHAVNLFAAAGAFGGTFTGKFNNNVIGNAGVANSGSDIGNGVRVNINGGSDATLQLTGNTIRQTPNGRGIEIIGRNGTGGLDITVTNNDVNPQALANPLAAILVQSNCLTTCNTVRSDVRGNTVPAASDVTDLLTTYIELVESGASTSELVDTTAPISGTCASELAATNTGSTGVLGGCTLIAGPISVP